MKFLQVHTFYDAYVSEFYRTRPGLESRPFSNQIDELVKDGFSGSHLFAPYLTDLGYDSNLIIANAIPAQLMWCQQHGIRFDESKWQADIFRQQVDAIEPDILYVTCPITFDSSFIRSLKKRPRVVMGWRAADIPDGTDFSEFQLVLSSDSVSRKRLLELGAKAVQHFVPGVPKFLAHAVASEQKEVDVVFSGLHSSQHLQRNEMLKVVGKAPLGWRGEFSIAYYLLTVDPSQVAMGIAMYDRGPRFGVEMHRVLAQGRMALNGIGDAFRGEAGNMRQFEATSARTLLLTEEHETLQQYFEPGREVETFKDTGELLDKIYYYLEHPQKRETIAQAGYERFMRDHCMEVRVQELDTILKKLLENSTAVNGVHGFHPSPLKKGTMTTENIINTINNGRTTDALAAINDQLQISQVTSNLHYLKALGLARMGNFPEARSVLNNLVKANSFNPLVHTLLEEINGLSQTESNRAPATTPALNPNGILEQVVKLLETERPREALDITIEAKKSRVPVRDLDYLRAISFIKLGQIFDAKEALREELRYFPDNSEAKQMLEEVERELAKNSQPQIDRGDEFHGLLSAVRPYTMLSEERLFSLYSLARHVCEANIPGNFVECGVAAGGSSALLAFVLKRYSRIPRILYSLDSFSGMPTPGAFDTHDGIDAESTGWGSGTCSAPEQSLLNICTQIGVQDVVVPVKGYFEETIPSQRDWFGMIALLHLDGDWYESTKVILEQLYSRVVDGGYLQIDDFGYWDGCRRAVQEFEASRGIKFDLKVIDATGVCCEKPERFKLNPFVRSEAFAAFENDDPASKGITSQMSANERFQLHYGISRYVQGRSTPLRFVEVGCYAGASLALSYASLARKGIPLQGFAVEPEGQPQFYAIVNQLSHCVTHIKSFSHPAAEQLKSIFEADGNFPEFIFIDGDHTYEGVRQDILDYFPLLAPGGVIMFHDFLPSLDERNKKAIFFHHAGNEPGIRKACLELMEREFRAELLDIPLRSTEDITQTQAHLPIIPGVYSTIRAYRKRLK